MGASLHHHLRPLPLSLPSLLPPLSLLLILLLTTGAAKAFVTPSNPSVAPARVQPHRLTRMSSADRSVRQPKKTIAFEAALKDKGAPAVILVRPYLDENIGSCARAMLNFGLTDLRIINPFCDHLTPMARARASGADAILEAARIFPDVGAAVSDLSEVIGTSARQRDMTVTIVTPEEAARLAVGSLESFAQGGARTGYMFGSERNGLINEDLVYATRLLQIPTNTAFSSLNLGQAVQICGYEYWKARAHLGDNLYTYKEATLSLAKGTRLATTGEVDGVWKRIQDMLDATELNPDPHVRRGLYDRLKSWLLRSRPDVRDVNALHGAVSTVVSKHEKLENLKNELKEANARGRQRATTPRREKGGGKEGGKERGREGGREGGAVLVDGVGEEEIKWKKELDRERMAQEEDGGEGWQDEEKAKRRGSGW